MGDHTLSGAHEAGMVAYRVAARAASSWLGVMHNPYAANPLRQPEAWAWDMGWRLAAWLDGKR